MTKDQFIANNLFRFIGCGCQDECPKTKSEDDLYLVSLEYFGCYEDDDCNFTYMSAKDGSLHHDTWTTRFAAPGFGTFLRMTVHDAVALAVMFACLIRLPIAAITDTLWPLLNGSRTI